MGRCTKEEKKRVISIHALLAESDVIRCEATLFYRRFQSTLSLRRATRRFIPVGYCDNISIHALLAESDHVLTSLLPSHNNFNPRSPCGERRSRPSQQPLPVQFQSTLSLRRATGFSPFAPVALTVISIHALLAESDRQSHTVPRVPQEFQSTLSLRRATDDIATESTIFLFQSTLSLRRATRLFPLPFFILPNFNPRSPCGERPRSRPRGVRPGYFNPRSPCGERPEAPSPPSHREGISIHALLAESDRCRNPRPTGGRNFNPRSPCGERPLDLMSLLLKPEFQSTLSLRRATWVLAEGLIYSLISIHALLAESDS